MKVAVTSASGQLGSSVVKALIEEIGAEQVIGVARTPERASHLKVEVRQGDYNSYDQFNSALKGSDVVVILSGNDDPGKRITQHRNIIRAAKDNGLQKIVYTSILGDETRTTFSSVIGSNRQTEQDIKNSGLSWVIGRNGIYLEPDIESLADYKKEGRIEESNKFYIKYCMLQDTIRQEAKILAKIVEDELSRLESIEAELAFAYAKLATDQSLKNQVFNLTGPAISQEELAKLLNEIFGTAITYEEMSVDDYLADRKNALGEFLGPIISGIYEGIRDGAFDVSSDFEKATGRSHKKPVDLIREIREKR